MQLNRLFSSESGFTLLEGLIAIAIFSIGLLAVGALQANSLRDTGDVARRTEAWTLADEQAALLKALPFYQNPATQTFSPELDVNGGGFAHQVDRQMNGTYTVHWRVIDDIPPLGKVDTTVTMLPYLPAGNFTVSKMITVVVTRQGGDPLNVRQQLAQLDFVKTWAMTDMHP